MAIDLRERKNDGCLRCSNQAERAEHYDGHTCSAAPSTLDGLGVRCVGEWERDKIYFLSQYLGIFAHGMKHKFRNLCYTEICSGPGRCVLRENGTEIDGTSLAVLGHERFNHVSRAIFIDIHSESVGILNHRIRDAGLASKAEAVTGDYSDLDSIRNSVSQLPQRNSLHLFFIDPTDCGVPFSTIEMVVRFFHKVDLVVNVATRTDANRNLAQVALNPERFSEARRKYLEFLGDPDFFSRSEVTQMANENNNQGLRELFREAYRDSLARIGHAHWAVKPIQHYYDLVYCSSDPRGLDFWDKACQIDPGGQRRLPI